MTKSTSQPVLYTWYSNKYSGRGLVKNTLAVHALNYFWDSTGHPVGEFFKKSPFDMISIFQDSCWSSSLVDIAICLNVAYINSWSLVLACFHFIICTKSTMDLWNSILAQGTSSLIKFHNSDIRTSVRFQNSL